MKWEVDEVGIDEVEDTLMVTLSVWLHQTNQPASRLDICLAVEIIVRPEIYSSNDHGVIIVQTTANVAFVSFIICLQAFRKVYNSNSHSIHMDKFLASSLLVRWKVS